MMADPEALVAQPLPDVFAVTESREPLRVLVASLALGGAERIVIDWLAAEARRGRVVELAVLHRRAREYGPPAHTALLWRGEQRAEAFIDALGERWRGAGGPVSVHLVGDALMARLWRFGIRTVPVLHNTAEGWRNDPASWLAEHVPLAIACAETVREQAALAGCRVPLVALRHRPRIGAAATDPAERRRIRETWRVAPDALLVGVVGAFKPQKDHARALEVLDRLRRKREACLVILGGALDAAGLAQVDHVMARAVALGLAHALRLPGFVEPVDPWYAAFDVLLNVSRHEGLSVASQEALAAGLPVVATDVGGQREIAHPNLHLLPADATPERFAARLAAFDVCRELSRSDAPRFPRAWTLATSWRHPRGPRLETLFVTANLNAGGAQRSLVNLAGALTGRHRFAVAVCNETTHPAFPAQLARAGIECFRPAASADAFDAAEGILARATRSGARNLCFWNVDPKVKLLVARFAPAGIRLVDVIPGAYAYEELASAGDLAQVLAFGADDYYARLDCLVTKYAEAHSPACRRVEVIPNGVALQEPRWSPDAEPRFLVSGRIAPSKRLETILEALRLLLARVPRARLEIAGQAEPRHRDYLASVLAIAKALPVSFRGAQPDLAFLREPFTAAVVLGTHQGCPNAVLEAMAAGLPVIANASGGTAQWVRDGETGWLLSEPCPATELAEAMNQAAQDAVRARRMGESARARVSCECRLDEMAVRYLSIFGPGKHRAPEMRESIHELHRLHTA